MQYNDKFGACPNCQVKPPSVWWRVAGWYWPLPLAIGLALQILAQLAGPAHDPAIRLPDVALIGQFIAGTLVFSVVAALLLFTLGRLRTVLRRKLGRRRRRGAWRR